MTKRPCLNCPDRRPGCHQNCKKHKNAGEEERAKMAWLNEKRAGLFDQEYTLQRTMKKLSIKK